MTSVIAVAIGGVFGAWSRWGLSYLLNGLLPPLPPGTLVANLIGGYLIGFFVALFSRHSEIPPEVPLLVITGFLGALTTFSTFSAEAVTLLRGQYVWATWIADDDRPRYCHRSEAVVVTKGVLLRIFVLEGQRHHGELLYDGCCAAPAKRG
jgi:fluoride exporter